MTMFIELNFACACETSVQLVNYKCKSVIELTPGLLGCGLREKGWRNEDAINFLPQFQSEFC